MGNGKKKKDARRTNTPPYWGRGKSLAVPYLATLSCRSATNVLTQSSPKQHQVCEMCHSLSDACESVHKKKFALLKLQYFFDENFEPKKDTFPDGAALSKGPIKERAQKEIHNEKNTLKIQIMGHIAKEKGEHSNKIPKKAEKLLQFCFAEVVNICRQWTTSGGLGIPYTYNMEISHAIQAVVHPITLIGKKKRKEFRTK